MPNLTVKMTDNGVLGRQLNARISRIVQATDRIAKAAADEATRVTRESFRYKRPANAGKRRGRSSTGGHMRQALQWRPNGSGGVAFDINQANQDAPHWIIQEVGTNSRALVRQGGVSQGRGRPSIAASNYVRVKSQVGRRISPRLAWGTGPRGQFVNPGDAAGQQLYLRSRLKGKSGPKRGMTIRREIEAQNFVQKGGQAGFRQYREQLLEKARREFADMSYMKRTRP